jgi:hypothetical protein
MASLTFLFFLFRGKAERHAVVELAGLGVERKSPNLKRVRHLRLNRKPSGRTHLKISERALHTVLPLILPLRLILLLAIANLPQHRPVVDLQLHWFLNWRGCRWLCR